MKSLMICVEDVKAGCYMPLMAFPNKVAAIRAFEALVNQEESIVAQHPKDFRLVHLGHWDDQSGEYERLPMFDVLAWAGELQRPKVDPRQLSIPDLGGPVEVTRG